MDNLNLENAFMIGLLNTWSLLAGFDVFVNTLKMENFKLIAITETLLNNDISNEAVSIDGYNLTGSDRQVEDEAWGSISNPLYTLKQCHLTMIHIRF